ncbi:F-box protein pof6 [Sphaceloma murrayae]|uniref:F-box protein pof6 n=1 Tax=Sphaceloma murrayae TaxID=2082308 RepID=A0A2K1QRJ6_9PEZI|nr:F-box protein pof6 [Sphaceloma murrayae]
MQQPKNPRKGPPQRTSIFDAEVKKHNVKRHSVLSSLRATSIVAQKPALPAELISVIIDYLPPAEQIRCAQVSRKLKEMVYDDARWIEKLQTIGVWDEHEARQRYEEAMRKRMDAAQRTANGNTNGLAGSTNQGPASSTTLFDMDVEAHKPRPRAASHRQRPSLVDGFDDLTLPSTSSAAHLQGPTAQAVDVLQTAKSIRGQARQQYGQIHGALNPFYVDITKPNDSVDPMVFRLFSASQHQAQVLANLEKFSRIDIGPHREARIEKLHYMTELFQNRMTNEFRQAYDDRDVERMRASVTVLSVLDGGKSAVDAFVDNHPLVVGTLRLANAHDCIEGVAFGHVDLSPSQRLFQRLTIVFSEQAALVDQTFPPNLDVVTPFLEKVNTSVIQPFVDTILQLTKDRGSETYLKAMPGVFEQCMRFSISLRPTKASPSDFQQSVQTILLQTFEPHVKLYLSEESTTFIRKASEEVSNWERDLSEQESRAETFFMSGINRQAVKRDFLSSFKKVVMMPVNVVTSFPLPGASRQSQLHPTEPEKPSQPTTPALTSSPFSPNTSTTPTTEPPQTELAAKAALMTSRLENIKSLFSIEVALNIVHHAKSAIERIAVLARHGERFKKTACNQCESIFISLLEILGDRHIKAGFDKAVGHLGSYNPRELRSSKPSPSLGTVGIEDGKEIGVEPLVTFLELVNVGDLIQQMVDVFFVQELVGPGLTDRDDFLNPASKEKKRFEQMLDERVAAGMSKGIDVLMGEVEWVCATTQGGADFNPGVDGSSASGVVDIGPTKTAREVVRLVESHTGMLVGSTEKTMLDVFYQEVGLRLFGAICKHVKRQRISVDGAMALISDINLYANFIASLKQKPLLPYFTALRELSQIYLVDCTPNMNASKGKRNARARELATIIADNERYKGIFGAEEVLEFAERRADWYAVRADVEKGLYGMGCVMM